MKQLTNHERKDYYTELLKQVAEGKESVPDNIGGLSKDDPIEVWVTNYLESSDPNYKGMTKEEIVKIAVGAYYGSQAGDQPGFDGAPGYGSYGA